MITGSLQLKNKKNIRLKEGNEHHHNTEDIVGGINPAELTFYSLTETERTSIFLIIS